MQKFFLASAAFIALSGACAAMAQSTNNAPADSRQPVSATQPAASPSGQNKLSGSADGSAITTNNPTGASPGNPLLGGTIGPGAPNHTGGMKGGTTAGGVGGAS